MPKQAQQLRVGIRAGDILLAIAEPAGLSARNVIAGRLLSLERRDMMISARVNCGVEMEVHLTLAARDALQLAAGPRGMARDQNLLLPPDAALKAAAVRDLKSNPRCFQRCPRAQF